MTGNSQTSGSDGEDVASDNPEKSFGTTVEEETMRFFYHPDHLGSSSRITDATGKVVQSLEYLPYGEVLLDLRHGDWNTPYLFNAKELDEETGLYYYGARYYNPRLGMWLTPDPMQEKYPSVSTYSYTFNNPVRLKDADGQEPISAVIEGITAFSISAGVDFINSWLIEGDDLQTSFRSVAWGAAAMDGIATCALSFVVSGTGTARTLAKIANSKAGRLTIDVVQAMTYNVMSQFEKNEIKSFSEVKLWEEFVYASFQTLLSKRLGERADELLESLKGKNATLYNRMVKYRRDVSLGKDGVRLKRDEQNVEVAIGESRKTTTRYVSESAKSKGTAGVTTSAIRHEIEKKRGE